MMQAEARKYNHKKDFKANSPAYDAAIRAGVLDQICKHMKPLRHDGIVLTEESFYQVAKQYKSPTDLLKNNITYHEVAKNQGVWMPVKKRLIDEGIWHERHKWDYDAVVKVAEGYEYRMEFRKAAPGAYDYALKKGILDDVCKHMKIKGNFRLRKVYVYEFPEKTCYVGLTCDVNRRKGEHASEAKSAVHQYIETSGVEYKFIELSDYIEKELASELEERTRQQYKADGWKVLNRIKAGGLGGYVKYVSYTMDEMRTAVAKCISRTDFHDKYVSIYNYAKRNRLLDDLCRDLPNKYQPIAKWTEEELDRVVPQYPTVAMLIKHYYGAYLAIRKRGLLDKYYPNRRGRK